MVCITLPIIIIIAYQSTWPEVHHSHLNAMPTFIACIPRHPSQVNWHVLARQWSSGMQFTLLPRLTSVMVSSAWYDVCHNVTNPQSLLPRLTSVMMCSAWYDAHHVGTIQSLLLQEADRRLA